MATLGALPYPGAMTADAATAMKARLRADLSAALKGRRHDELSVLRTLLAALDNAEAPEVPSRLGMMERGPSEIERARLSHDDVARVLEAEANARETAARQLEEAGQTARAAALLAEAALARRYL